MGCLEVAGIASILPFMQLAAQPDAIQQNEWLNWAYHYFGFSSTRSMQISTGVLVLILITFSNSFKVFNIWIQHKFAWDISHNLSIRLLDVHLRKPYSFFLQNNTSELKTNLLLEIARVTTGVITPILEFSSKIAVALIILLLLLIIDPMIALTVLLSLGGAYFIIYLLRQNVLKRLGKEREEANIIRLQNLDDLLFGLKTLRVYNAQDYFFNRFDKASAIFSKIIPTVSFITLSPRYSIEILAFGGIVMVTLFLLVSSDDLQSALPMLSLYAVAGYRLLPSLQQAFGAMAKLRHNFSVIDLIYEDLKQVVSTKPKKLPPIHYKEKIEFQNMSFYYSDAKLPTLAEIKLTIPKGQTIAFVGSTGSGKTTLINLVVGLLFASEGKILIDEQELTFENAASWQAKLAYVPQDIFLFNATVAQNIAIGLNDDAINLARVEAACKKANIYDFITTELPEKFDTLIGERGIRLSGGQKQRLGLARALYVQPELLVLDEATSALDRITENNVINSLKSIEEDLTVLIIAHRLSTVRHADCIYVLDSGKIIDSGTYDELIESNYIFRNMAKLS